jgi:hypothetical protein
MITIDPVAREYYRETLREEQAVRVVYRGPG